MRNSVGSRAKKSQVEVLTNWQIILIFCLQCVCCLVATIYGTIWRELNLTSTESYFAAGGPRRQRVREQLVS